MSKWYRKCHPLVDPACRSHPQWAISRHCHLSKDHPTKSTNLKFKGQKEALICPTERSPFQKTCPVFTMRIKIETCNWFLEETSSSIMAATALTVQIHGETCLVAVKLLPVWQQQAKKTPLLLPAFPLPSWLCLLPLFAKKL